MSNWMMILRGGLGVLPIVGGVALLLIVMQYFSFRKMGKQFSDCVVRKGIVEGMRVQEATRNRPYRHCVVTCSFSGGKDLVAIPYDNGDLKDVQTGDELSLYFYPNGVTTVVAYDEETTKKKFKQQVLRIGILCVILAFFIPAVGMLLMNKFPK